MKILFRVTVVVVAVIAAFKWEDWRDWLAKDTAPQLTREFSNSLVFSPCL